MAVYDSVRVLDNRTGIPNKKLTNAGKKAQAKAGAKAAVKTTTKVVKKGGKRGK